MRNARPIRTPWLATLLFWLLAAGLAGCSAGRGDATVVANWDPTRQVLEGAVLRGGRGGKCTPPPAPFQDSALVGTWVDHLGVGAHTTLILRADHTYTQIYVAPVSGVHYESAGDQRWWVEERDSGIPLLHLQGMPDCANRRGPDCAANQEPGGGVWWDWCTGASVRFQDEVVVLITGVNSPPFPPRSLWLRYLKADPDYPVGAFELQE